MPSREQTRRHILRASSLTLIGVAGCLSGNSPSESPASETDGTAQTPQTQQSRQSPSTTASPTGSATDGEPSVASLSVQDYVQYPLAGVHPHVHRRADTQYVIVRVQTTADEQTFRNRLSLTLNSESIPLADQQPVPWENDTVDTAFAVSKSTTYDSGRVLIDGSEARSLSMETLTRLNNPPVFEVSNPTAFPAELQAGETTNARVQFSVSNTGDGAGEFAASLSGNAVSGSSTVTGRVEVDERRQFNAATTVAGSGDAARLRLDWGSDQWTGSIPVVGAQTTTDSETTDASTRSDPAASDALVIESRHAVDGTMVNLGAEGTARNTASRALVECVIDVSGDVGGETYTARATRDRLEPDETWEWSVTFGDEADASNDDSVESLSVETRAMYAE